MNYPLLESVHAWLDAAHRVVFFTGAGMSAECGIPTFREAQTGFWARFDPMELASPQAFARHPEQVLAWYAERRATALACTPHAGYQAIVDLAATHEVTVITQNVDRLHQRAGSTDVIELHGNLMDLRCHRCGRLSEQPPRTATPYLQACSACNGPLRPDIVWFGEALPATALAAAEEALSACDLLFIVGTSASVYPAAALPELAKTAGAKIVLVNPEPTEHAALADVFLPGPAGVVLPQLLG